jgi:hypothetical protein
VGVKKTQKRFDIYNMMNPGVSVVLNICHASRRAVQWKRENELNCLNWPSQSPDLNIIENVWKTIKIKLQNSKCDFLNKKVLVREVKKIWVHLMTCGIYA